MSVQGCREGSFPTFLLPLHIFRYDELRKDGIDDEIHSENIPCAPYAGLVDHRVCMQAGAQAFLRGLCAALHPVFVVAGIYHFANGSTLNGCIGLAIAFLLSPYGLSLLAVKLTARFIVIRMLLKERIYGLWKSFN